MVVFVKNQRIADKLAIWLNLECLAKLIVELGFKYEMTWKDMFSVVFV